MNDSLQDPRETLVPLGSKIAARCVGADFRDAWCVDSISSRRSALEHYIAAVARTPLWVRACMALRNRAVALVGLKDLGRLSARLPDKPTSARPGDRVGIFTLLENSFDEVLLGDEDKHLRVVLSVHQAALPAPDMVRLTVTTVVHVHNTLGRLYMLPVKPMHRIIVPALLGSIARTQASVP